MDSVLGPPAYQVLIWTVVVTLGGDSKYFISNFVIFNTSLKNLTNVDPGAIRYKKELV